MGTLHSIAVAGRALSGWQFPHLPTRSAQCCFVDSANKSLIENLITDLLHARVEKMKPQQPLWPVATTMFATLLMHLEDFERRYPQHFAIHRLYEVAHRYNINKDQLFKW